MKRLVQIADDLGVPPWKISYVVHTRRIGEQQRVGNVRLFDPATVRRIVEEVGKMRGYKKREPAAAS